MAVFPDFLEEHQRVNDALAAGLGEMVKTPEANIIKVPNISASVPQLTATIEELQSRGLSLSQVTQESPANEEEEIHQSTLR